MEEPQRMPHLVQDRCFRARARPANRLWNPVSLHSHHGLTDSVGVTRVEIEIHVVPATDVARGGLGTD